MNSAAPSDPRTTLFLGIVALSVAISGAVALLDLCWTRPRERVVQAFQALAEDPTPILVRTIGMSAEMVRILEKGLTNTGYLALFSTDEGIAFDRQVFRCQEFFYPHKVVGWHSAEEVESHLKDPGPVFVLDYSVSPKHTFSEPFTLVSEHLWLRMWRRGEIK